MKKMFCAALLMLAVTAYATPGGEGGNTNCSGQGNSNSPCAGSGGQGGAGGAGGQGGTGVGVGIAGAAVVGSGNSSNTNTLGQHQGQAQQQTATGGAGGDASATGGQGGNATATGNGSGNATTVAVKGAERSAPGLGGAIAPVQVRNCRVGIGFGGSNANGAFTAAVPLGNDQTCLVGAMLEAMETAGGFSMKSKQTVACTIEGMDVLDECKALKAKPARSTASDAPKPWQAGG